MKDAYSQARASLSLFLNTKNIRAKKWKKGVERKTYIYEIYLNKIVKYFYHNFLNILFLKRSM